MNTEIYYKFIFPRYSKLSVNSAGEDYVPTSDGDSQLGEVRALCNACPERVITYDQLDITKSLDGPDAWADSSVWPDSKKNEIKHYVDHYLSTPKYFDLRNYWDDKPCQEGGMSLMVFHSPEIGFTSTDWTKCKITHNDTTKYVYYSIIVSSGDFFYCWNLPDTVLAKSGLRDSIVANKFHSNWYLKNGSAEAQYHYNTERNYYFYGYSPAVGRRRNAPPGKEKGVFNQIYFEEGDVLTPGMKYVDLKNEYGEFYPTYKDIRDQLIREGVSNPTYEQIADKYNSTVKRDGGTDTLSILHLNTSDPAYTDISNREYRIAYADPNPNSSDPSKTNGEVAIQDAIDDDADYLKYQQLAISKNWWNVGDHIGLPYYIYPGPNLATTYKGIYDDLKKDYIDLEATRRILYYCSEHHDPCLKYPDGTHVNRCTSLGNIPIIVSGFGKATELSFEPPQEYIDKPPLQIPYNLLRYSLNDRPPFSDCETVLVMWVADNDPDNLADGDVAGLHNLNWQQYAIPLSVRCCFKDVNNNGKYSKDRFLVSYPHVEDYSTTPPYRFHIRRNTAYVKDQFEESLFLQGLIRHSKDNLIVCRNTRYDVSSFSIQKFVFQHCDCSDKKDVLKALYIKKCPRQYGRPGTPDYMPAITGNQQTQLYYLYVPKELYTINTTLSTCIADVSGNDVLEPFSLDYFSEANFSRYDFNGPNDWGPNNEWFITIFDKSKVGTQSSPLQEVSGKLKLVNASSLKSSLPEIHYTTLPGTPWNDIYLNSFGISPISWVNADSILSDSISGFGVSLDYLHNHIQIGDTVYGTDEGLNNKVVVGFKDVFDYTYSDCHHFRYNSETDTYDLVNNTDHIYTAYVLDYS